MAGEFTWPTFPGEDGAPEVETICGRTVPVKLQSGGRYVVSLSTAVRYRYTFRYAGLRPDLAAPYPYQAQSEIQCVRSLLASLQGGLGACYVVDPIDNVARLCRLESDSIVAQRVAGTFWWETTITFYTVG